jgi:hypothetical protein
LSWYSDFTVVNAFENIVEARGKPFSLYIHSFGTETNAKSTDRRIFEYHFSICETVSALLLWDYFNQIKIIISKISFPWGKITKYTINLGASLKSIIFHLQKGPGGLKSLVVWLPNNSYNPITNTVWVHVRLCKLQKRCNWLAAASDQAYQLFAQGRWFSPGTSTFFHH